MEKNFKRAVGIDLGKRTMEVRFIDENEMIQAWNAQTDSVGREKLYAKLKEGDLVGIEVCSLAFIIAKEIKEKTKADVVVLNALEISHNICKHQEDRFRRCAKDSAAS